MDRNPCYGPGGIVVCECANLPDCRLNGCEIYRKYDEARLSQPYNVERNIVNEYLLDADVTKHRRKGRRKVKI